MVIKIMNPNNTRGCQRDCGNESKNNNLKKDLVITWQRLISDGATCPRCRSTKDELDKAVLELKEKLGPLGIKIIFEKKEITLEEFKKNPVKSNSILFNGCLLEDIIDAKTGQSQCCDVCGDEQCRTIETKENSYETVPAEIITKAGLMVADQLHL